MKLLVVFFGVACALVCASARLNGNRGNQQVLSAALVTEAPSVDGSDKTFAAVSPPPEMAKRLDDPVTAAPGSAPPGTKSSKFQCSQDLSTVGKTGSTKRDMLLSMSGGTTDVLADAKSVAELKQRRVAAHTLRTEEEVQATLAECQKKIGCRTKLLFEGKLKKITDRVTKIGETLQLKYPIETVNDFIKKGMTTTMDAIKARVMKRQKDREARSAKLTDGLDKGEGLIVEQVSQEQLFGQWTEDAEQKKTAKKGFYAVVSFGKAAVGAVTAGAAAEKAVASGVTGGAMPLADEAAAELADLLWLDSMKAIASEAADYLPFIGLVFSGIDLAKMTGTITRLEALLKNPQYKIYDIHQVENKGGDGMRHLFTGELCQMECDLTTTKRERKLKVFQFSTQAILAAATAGGATVVATVANKGFQCAAVALDLFNKYFCNADMEETLINTMVDKFSPIGGKGIAGFGNNDVLLV